MAIRKALDVEPGDEVRLLLNDGVLEVRTLEDGVKAAQALVRRHVSRRRSLVDELIAERRLEDADD